MTRKLARAVSTALFVSALTLVATQSTMGQTAEQTANVSSGVERLKAEYRRPKSIPFPEDNPYSKAKAHLGKTLYFDPRLSSSNLLSCASCHNPSFAWGDGLPKGIGDGMSELGRRSPTTLNVAWGEIFMWDGRFETLEEQALGPIESHAEMNMPIDELLKKLEKIGEYRALFAVAFDGDPTITADRIAMAIATYERTIVSGIAPFDRWVDGDQGAISEEAKRGFALFNGKARCVACHSDWRFTDDSFHDIGLPDGDIGRGEHLPQIEKMQHAFKTPGLRNINRRGPYMHDGSLPTLDAVVRHYNEGFLRRPSLSNEMVPLGLSRQEQSDLVAFLHTLTGQEAPTTFVQLPR